MASAAAVLVGVLATGGCYTSSAPPETVALLGYLWSYEDDTGIAGADFAATTRAGDPLSVGETDAYGVFFAGGLEKEIPVAIGFERAGYVPAVFTGHTAQRDSLLIFRDFLPHLERVATVQEFIDEYSAAAGIGPLMTLGSNGGGGIVRGVARTVTADEGGVEFLPAEGVDIDVFDASGNDYRVFYADEEGVLDPDRTVTGDGTFAAFAVQATGASAAFSRNVGQVTIRVVGPGGFDEQTILIDGGITELGVFTVF